MEFINAPNSPLLLYARPCARLEDLIVKKQGYGPCSHGDYMKEEMVSNQIITLVNMYLKPGKCSEGKELSSLRAVSKESDLSWDCWPKVRTRV